MRRVTKRAASRLARQRRILATKTLAVLVDELALYRHVGSAGIMGAQIDRLLEIGALSDGNVLGSWLRTPGNTGLRYSVIIPPAGLAWGADRIVTDLTDWLVRHVISRVQEAARPRR